MFRVLFVCSGNICRSPTAEAVFRGIVEADGLGAKVAVDSAGTHGFHAGEPPDARAGEAAERRGLDLSAQRARQVRADDFDAFDLILAMDRGHLRQLRRRAPRGARARLRLFLEAAPHLGRDVPDPYYGGEGGFETVFDLIEAGARALADELRRSGEL